MSERFSSRINVPKLIAAHAHEENPNFTPKEQRAIMAWMSKEKARKEAAARKKGKRRGK